MDGQASALTAEQAASQEPTQPARFTSQASGVITIVKRHGDGQVPAALQAPGRQGGSRPDDRVGVFTDKGPVQQAFGQVTVIS